MSGLTFHTRILFCLVKWTEIFNIHYNFHMGNKKSKMGFLGFVNPCLWKDFAMQQSHSGGRAASRWDCGPERGLSPFALGTWGPAELQPFGVGRLETHRTGWPAGTVKGPLNGPTSSLGSRDSCLPSLMALLGDLISSLIRPLVTFPNHPAWKLINHGKRVC